MTYCVAGFSVQSGLEQINRGDLSGGEFVSIFVSRHAAGRDERVEERFGGAGLAAKYLRALPQSLRIPLVNHERDIAVFHLAQVDSKPATTDGLTWVVAIYKRLS